MIGDILAFTILGILTGSLYGLVGLGLNVIFGVMRVINVSHGEMLTVGAYTAVVIGMAGSASPMVTLPGATAVAVLLGLIVARLLLAPLTTNGVVQEQRGLVVTLGLGVVLSNGMLELFGPDYQRVPGRLAGGVITFGDLVIQRQRLAILLISLLLAAALTLFLRHTRLGHAIRAVGENPEAAQASGISVRRMHLLTFAIGTGLAGIAGALVAPVTYAFPAMGLGYTLDGFAVVIIGGLGSIWGAMLAGLLLGVAESLSVLWMPSGYNAVIGPVLMLLTLILRPQGLLGRPVGRA